MPYDWILGLSGGLLIGLGAATYLLVNGRIMGASGILGGLVDRSGSDTTSERVVFLISMIAVPAVLSVMFGEITTNLTPNLGVLIIAGLCVGIGTRLANGCTSGHGVCGISRLSWRGIAATLIYIGAGAISIAALRNIAGLI